MTDNPFRNGTECPYCPVGKGCNEPTQPEWEPVATIMVDGEEVTGPLVRWWATPPVPCVSS